MVIFGGCALGAAFGDVWRLRIQAGQAQWKQLQTNGRLSIKLTSFKNVYYRLGLRHLSTDSPAGHSACHAPKSAVCMAISFLPERGKSWPRHFYTAAVLGSTMSICNVWLPFP